MTTTKTTQIIEITDDMAWSLAIIEKVSPPYSGYGFHLKDGRFLFCKDGKFYLKK